MVPKLPPPVSAITCISGFLRAPGNDAGLLGMVGSRKACRFDRYPLPRPVEGWEKHPLPYLDLPIELALCIILCDMCVFTLHHFVLLFKYASVHV